MSAPKILSVDDSRMIHTLINKAFAPHDVQMVFASNGAEGLEAAEREKPDVILLDVTMPVMDGIECLTKLKATPSLKDIPVIMLTAEAGKE
ncbi:MAG: response regulator, partial [Terrimicrobiaceae bacterium]